MVNQTKTLARLNQEKEYEEKLSKDLLGYLISNIDNIQELDEEKKKTIKFILNEIAKDSQRHEFIFSNLMQMVLENGENNY